MTTKPIEEINAKMGEIDSGELAQKRKDYYSQWNSFTKDAVTKTKEQEEEEKEAAKHKLGLDKDEPKSEAEKRDREKRAALKEAKKLWDGKQATEQQQKFVLSGENGAKRNLTRADIDHRPVLVIKGATDCHYTLADNLGTLIKVFIEECAGTRVIVKCPLITQHVEVSHSERTTVEVAIPVQTVQVDLSSDITIVYNQNVMQEGNKVYHAGVKGLTVRRAFEGDETSHDYQLLEEDDPDAPKEELQFITHLKNDKLKTERVRRAHGMMPLTDEELSKVAGTEDIENASRRQGLEKKNDGNEAFKNGEHLQAAVLYTQAMKLAPSDQELLTTCLANRAACNLKLGRLDEALEDANACIELDSKHVKGWFRKGMALHAMKSYGPAIAALSKANDLEPKNKQIVEAIGFAKVLLAKQLREEQDNRI